MKKIIYIIIFIISFICFTVTAYAYEVAVINGYGVRFRTSPDTSTSNNIITSFNPGVELELLDKNAGVTNSCSKWYKVRRDGVTGYVCGDYVTIKEVNEEEIDPNEYEEYSDYLREKGFPDSYIPSLIILHGKHPNWQFQVINADITFQRMVKLEHDGLEAGWSLFEDIYRNYDGYKATDSWGYNYLTDEFRSNYEGGGVNRWYAPNTTTISYYVDPRNFLTESGIFMFETLSYKPAYQTKEVVEIMLRGTFMQNAYADSTNNKTYADAFIDAAQTLNVSPYALISRVIQEVGANGSTIVSGTYPGYEGYYNFYNIKAYGNTTDETIRNGLKYAKEQGWDTPYKAIIGGGNFLATSYINVGQDTIYLQKWDIFGPKPATHQYMQNIEAPYNEAIKTYRGYNKAGLIDNNFLFVIPVYREMPGETSLPNAGNPNNYLSSLTINGKVVFSSATNETNYSLTLPSNTSSLTISANTVNSKASYQVVGSTIMDTYNKELSIIVTAANGDKRTYNINITKETEKIIPEISFANTTYEKIYGDNDITITPNINISDVNINYTSSNPNIAEVNENGKVTIKKIGSVVITATTEETDTYISVSASYTLNISKQNIEIEVSNYESTYEYNYEPITPDVIVSSPNIVLVKDIDYTIKYENNNEVGTAKIIIESTNDSNYIFDSKEISFTIKNNMVETYDTNNNNKIDMEDIVSLLKTYLGMNNQTNELNITLSDIISLIKIYLNIE